MAYRTRLPYGTQWVIPSKGDSHTWDSHTMVKLNLGIPSTTDLQPSKASTGTKIQTIRIISRNFSGIKKILIKFATTCFATSIVAFITFKMTSAENSSNDGKNYGMVLVWIKWRNGEGELIKLTLREKIDLKLSIFHIKQTSCCS